MSMARCAECSQAVDTDDPDDGMSLTYGERDERPVCEGCRAEMHVCTQCGHVCDTVEESEIESSEAWGAVEVQRVTFLVSNCCLADVKCCA